MDFEKSIIEITWSGRNVGCKITEDGRVLSWEDLNREEQCRILNSISTVHKMFIRFIKEG